MTQPVYLDTGAAVAVAARRDQHHDGSIAALRRFRKERRILVTTNHVLSEAYTLCRSRYGHTLALRVANTILRSPEILCLHVAQDQEAAALRLLEGRPDKTYSFTDAVSFVVMRAERIVEAFTFDDHFVQEGFVVLPADTVREPCAPYEARPAGAGADGQSSTRSIAAPRGRSFSSIRS